MKLLLSLLFLIVFSGHGDAGERLVVGRDLQLLDAVAVKLGGEVFVVDEPNRFTDIWLRTIAILAGVDIRNVPRWEGAPVPFVVGTVQGINNAYAGIHLESRYRVILFDPGLSSDYNNFPSDAGLLFLLGHEIGHHACGHSDGSRRSNNSWQRELEADRYAGASIRRLENTLNERHIESVLSAARRIVGRGGGTHPPTDQRLAAIWTGYTQGSPCSVENLAIKID